MGNINRLAADFSNIHHCISLSNDPISGNTAYMTDITKTYHISDAKHPLHISLLNLLMLEMEYCSFRLTSIPCLLMPWLLKSPVHQHTLYCLCRIENIYHCSKVNFFDLGQANSMRWFKMWISIVISKPIQQLTMSLMLISFVIFKPIQQLTMSCVMPLLNISIENWPSDHIIQV